MSQPDAEGEIAAEGPSVHLGYHKNPAANAELFTVDGWFRTGDLGQLDTVGNVKIVGRLKEIINRRGQQFFPREIEEILYTHPKILHAAIIGVPDPRLGERRCLCVIPRARVLAFSRVPVYAQGHVALAAHHVLFCMAVVPCCSKELLHGFAFNC